MNFYILVLKKGVGISKEEASPMDAMEMCDVSCVTSDNALFGMCDVS